VKDGRTNDDKEIVQDPYSNSNHEKWSITPNGAYFVIKAKHSGKAMSIKGASMNNGADAVQKGTGINTHEQWTFVEVPCVAPFTASPELIVSAKSGVGQVIESALSVSVLPNPSSTYFNLVIKSSDFTPANVRIFDVNGKVISLFNKTGINSTLKLGSENWAAGTYYAEVTQGSQRKVVKLVKTK